ncbi:MAG: hypothetical protein Q8Q74_11420, partial [Polaromonas sp.]|nr:hypothetical protein [Polaromonas sp.]
MSAWLGSKLGTMAMALGWAMPLLERSPVPPGVRLVDEGDPLGVAASVLSSPSSSSSSLPDLSESEGSPAI